MPSTHIWNVCITCRNIHPQYDVIKDADDNIIDRICKVCKGHVSRAPYKWSPPKKRDNRAWKRIERGDWLWDHRRIQRARKTWRPWERVTLPGHKKGQQGALTGGYRSDAKVELGA